MTEYVILRKDGQTWQVQALEVKAPSAKAAIRAYVNGKNTESAEAADPGTYVAVPARSWQPITVVAETSVKLTLGIIRDSIVRDRNLT